MPWIQLKLQTNAEYVETVSDHLMELGALSVTYQDAADQPLFEPPPGETPIWSDTQVTGLFEADTDIEPVREALANQFGQRITPSRSEILEDKDWVREWMDSYQPMQFGKQLWIVPSHHTPPDPSAVNILLDPGLAFGTGTHPTTAMCLRWLASNPPVNQIVIDYGCGSGILAIAAARLAARRVYAIDNDPQALLATRSNAQQNQVAELIECGGVDHPLPPEADCLLANILAAPLISLAPYFADRLHTGGKLVLSGILKEQADAVRAAYMPWFDLEDAQQQEDWILFSGRRKS